jgi:HD-GYP domain-containing protein (c-di-GMP phosphodiesterase class II)
MVGTESNDREARLAPDEDETPAGGPADDPEDSEASPPRLSAMLERDDEPLPDTPLSLESLADIARPAAQEDEDDWFALAVEASVREEALTEPTVGLAFPEVIEEPTPLADPVTLGESLPSQSTDAWSLYQQARRTVETAFARIQAGEPVDSDALGHLAGQMVSNLLGMPPSSYDLRSSGFSQLLASCLYDSFGTQSDLVGHCLNVAILGVLLARDQVAPERELERFCLAALVHDVGMLFVPSGVWEHDRPIGDEEREGVRRHAEIGRERLAGLVGSLSELAPIVGQEHERVDGSGYPKGLKGQEIHWFAQIIGLADVFEALTHDRPHRRAQSPHQAVRTILADMREAFDAELLRAFLALLTVYPLGSFVELSTGAVGRVVQVNEANHLRPVVEIVRDPKGLSVQPPTVLELQGVAGTTIVRCLEGPPEPPGGRVA